MPLSSLNLSILVRYLFYCKMDFNNSLFPIKRSAHVDIDFPVIVSVLEVADTILNQR